MARPDAEDVMKRIERRQAKRSKLERELDSQRDAEITVRVNEWLDNPDELDYPGVDTGPKFRKEQRDDFNTESFLETFLD